MPLPLPPNTWSAAAGTAPAVSLSPLARAWWGRGEALAAGVPWVMRRNCSIAPAQLLAVYLGLCAVAGGIGLFFYFQGATLVIGFAALELLLVGAALWLVARHAGDRETLQFFGRELEVESIAAATVTRTRLRSDWTSVEPAAGQGSLVLLASQGQRVTIGRFVRPEERAALAREVRHALRRVSQRPAWEPHPIESPPSR